MTTFPSQTQAEDQRCQDTVLELGGYTHQAKNTISHTLRNHMHHVFFAGVATAYDFVCPNAGEIAMTVKWSFGLRCVKQLSEQKRAATKSNRESG